MGVFSWPGLEKRKEDFKQSASSEEMTMVYVKEGTATISDAEESKAVKSGQMVNLGWRGPMERHRHRGLTHQLDNRALRSGGERRRRADPLSLAAGQGRERPLERQQSLRKRSRSHAWRGCEIAWLQPSRWVLGGFWSLIQSA